MIFKKLLLFLISFLLLFGLISRCAYDPLSYDDVLNANWGIRILRGGECKLIYDKSTLASFNGDGCRYHVYEYADEAFLTSALPWQCDDRPTIFAGSLAEASTAIANTIGVKDAVLPNYRACRSYYASQDDSSEMIIFLDTEKQYLYIFESFF